MSNVRCLTCGYRFDQALEMCPKRYLSPHDQETLEREAERHLFWSALIEAQLKQIK